MDIIEKKYQLSVEDEYYADKKITILNADGMISVKGSYGDNTGCSYFYNGGKWFIQSGKLILKIKVRDSSGCSGRGPYIESHLKTKKEFLGFFSGSRDLVN